MLKRSSLACLSSFFLILAHAWVPGRGAEPIQVGPSVAVSDYTVSLPHAKVTFYSGRASRLLSGSQCVGLCFQGSGGMDYVTTLGTELQALQYNLAHNGAEPATKGPDGWHVTTHFKQAVIWLAGQEAQPFQGPDGPALDEVFKTFQDKFQSDGLPLPLAAVRARNANGGQLPYVQAILDGGPRTLAYEFDPTHSRFESLYLLSRDNMDDPALKGMYNPVTLSHQPIGWDLHQPVSGDYLLQAVDVDLTQTAPLKGLLKVKERILPLSAPLKAIRMNFDTTRWGRNAYGPISHQARITKVSDDHGHDLEFAQDPQEVTVFLSGPAAPGSPVELSFQIEGDFLVPPTNGHYWQLGTSAWFPQPDLNGQMYSWHAVVRVKKPYLAFSDGETVRRWTEGDYQAVETRSEHPIAFGVILAGNYEVERETRDGLTIEIGVYGGKAQFSKALLDMAFHAIKYYENFLGPYPYKEFHILEKAEWGYGQAPATIMFITKEAFNQTLTIVNQYVAQDVRGRFVHEIAHQWWGTVVKMPSVEEQWLTEAFAEASASLCLQDWPQHRADAEYAKLIARWKTEAAFATDKATIPTANVVYNPDDSYQNFRIRTGLIYNKGAWLLYCIRQELGDKAFLTFLKSYQRNFRWKFGSTKDVAGLLGFITKKDWRPWFEENYWGTGCPEAKK